MTSAVSGFASSLRLVIYSSYIYRQHCLQFRLIDSLCNESYTGALVYPIKLNSLILPVIKSAAEIVMFKFAEASLIMLSLNRLYPLQSPCSFYYSFD